ncbi:MAG: PAS domain S-box protein [Pseudomonadota bacterium]
MLTKNMDTLGNKIPFRSLVLMPFAALAALLATWIIWAGYESKLSEISRIAEKDRSTVERSFASSLADRSQRMKTLLDQIAQEAALREALEARARYALRRAAAPVFRHIKAVAGITHFSFYLPDRTNFLRLHEPILNGDFVDHVSIREAERTGKSAAAFDWGVPEAFSLRVVRPLFMENGLAGYVEVGQEVGIMLSDMSRVFGAEVYLALRTPSPDQNALMEEMSSSLQTDWSPFHDSVILYGKAENHLALAALSRPKKPPLGWRLFRSLVYGEKDTPIRDQTRLRVGENWLYLRGKHYSKASQPVSALGNIALGDLVLLRDVTEQVEAIDRKINSALLFTLAALGLILTVVYRLVARIEKRQVSSREMLIDEAAEREMNQATRIRQLENERERLRNAQRLGKVGSWEWDSGIKRITWSNESYELFDLEPDQFDQSVSGFLGLVHPEDKPTVTRQVKALVAEPNRSQSEFRILTPTNGQRFVRFTSEPVLDKHGRLQRIRGTVQDITDRKAAENALRRTENRVDWISCAVHDAIIVLDDQGKVVYWNPGAERILGYPAEEALGKEIHRFFVIFDWPDVYRRGFAGPTHSAGRPTGIQCIEVVVIRKDGREFPAEFSLSTTELDGKRCAVGVLRDMTGRKLSEETSRRISRALGAIHTAGIFYARSGDLQQLLNDACGIIVELAGYRFAGVGTIPRGGERGVVKLAAHAGKESGLLEVLTTLCETSWNGNSPVTEVIGTGRSRIVSASENDLNDTPWIQEAHKHQCGEIIVLPLTRGNQHFGVLILCAAARRLPARRAAARRRRDRAGTEPRRPRGLAAPLRAHAGSRPRPPVLCRVALRRRARRRHAVDDVDDHRRPARGPPGDLSAEPRGAGCAADVDALPRARTGAA